MQRGKYSGIICGVLFLLFLIIPAAGAEEDRLNIIYTGDLQGQLEPCGCSPVSDFGGIARVYGYISSHEKELSPYILMDAGGFAGKDTPQGRLKTEAVLQFMNMLRYDAVGQFDEAQASQGALQSLLASYNLPLLSRSGQSIDVMKESFPIHVSTNRNAPERGSLNILLTDITSDKAKTLKDWDVIITSSGEEIEEPLLDGDVVVVAGYPKGKKIGVLTVQQDGKGGYSFSHRWKPTGNDIEENEKARTILDDYDRKVTALMKEADRPPPGTTYTGGAACAECHQPFVKSWKETGHAHAFASLEAVGKDNDPECVVCHVVGYGEAGGFFTLEATPGLADVQCEECHGIGREHLADYEKPLTAVTEMRCLKCHTEENSPEFDYPVYREKIRH